MSPEPTKKQALAIGLVAIALGTGSAAGPLSTSPVVTSNCEPWHEHVTVVPSSSPLAREHPACVHRSPMA